MPGETREQAAAWVDEHAADISVREFIDGAWMSITLAELPDPLRHKWRATFIERRLQGAPVYLGACAMEGGAVDGAINEGQGFRVKHLWAILSVHGDEEGIVAVPPTSAAADSAVMTPLVTAFKGRVADLATIARHLGKEHNMVMTLARFDVRADVETFYPDGRRERPSRNG